MSTNLPARRLALRQRGFSLIEVMIGLLIAMIGVVIMMEVLLNSEQRTRTTSTGNDALSNGAVMMHMLQRDLVQSGYGINAVGLVGCSLTLPAPASRTIPIAPAVINPATSLVPAADANTDRLLIMYGSDNGQPEGNEIFAVNGNDYSMQAPNAFAVGDYVVATTGGCPATLTLARVTAVTALTVTVNTVTATAKALFNLGATPHIVAYAVRNGSLTSCDYMAADCGTNNATNWASVGGNIVSLRAQYGRDTTAGTADGIVDVWDQNTPSAASTTASCDWVRVPAVRYVLVAKGTQYESTLNGSGRRVGDTVTTTDNAPTWKGNTGAPITLTGNSDWQSYRYRTFENVAPARNMVWMEASSGC